MMATLKMSRNEAAELLTEQMEKGADLMGEIKKAPNEQAYKRWQLDVSRWRDLTKAALRHIYVEDDPVEEFERVSRFLGMVVGLPWQHYAGDDHDTVGREVNKLISFRDRLRFDSESAGPAYSPRPHTSEGDAVIFLVHGRDTGRREEVARFLEKAGEHDVIILDERANRGRTLVEKLEEHAQDAKYAVVLLTGEDVGGLKGSKSRKPRARQNVVFELGWFCGQIGRENVAVLYEPDVELPSDIDGLAYIAV